jgi:ElaB/YqjD/DUF883 family membrane-anchored ribosome-binding protein
MTTTNDEQTDTPSDPDELRHQIEQTRAELGETVEALVAKADVPGRVKEKLSTTKEQLGERLSETTGKARELADSLPERAKEKPAVPAGVVLAVVGVLLGLWLIRRRR